MRTKLTEQRCEVAKPATRRKVIFDTVATGLAFKIQPTGRKTWAFVVRIGKRQRWIDLGEYQPGLRGPEQPGSLVWARAEVARLRADVLAGGDPANARIDARMQRATRTTTFGELCEAWLLAARTGQGRVAANGKPLGPRKTWQQDRERLDRDFDDWMPLRLDSLTPAVVATRIAWIAKRSTTTANRCVALLSSIFRSAVENGAIDANPTARIRRSKEPPRDRYLDDDESGRLLAAIDAEPDRRWRAFFGLSLLLGTRRGELLALRWAEVRDLDGDRPVIDLRATTTKTGDGRSLPLPESATKLLRDLASDPLRGRRAGAFVFSSPSSASGHLIGVRKAWLATCARAGITGCHLHDLRRSLASGFAAADTPASIAQHVLGHRTASTTASVYTRSASDTRRRALDAHAARLEAARQAHVAKVVELRAVGEP